MRSFSDIEGIDSSIEELLEAAGYLTPATFTAATPEYIHAELAKANEMLDIVEVTPSLEDVSRWVEAVGGVKKSPRASYRALGDQAAAVGDDDDDGDGEDFVVVRPSAIPLSESFIEQNKVNVNSLPEAGTEVPETRAATQAVIQRPEVEPEQSATVSSSQSKTAVKPRSSSQDDRVRRRKLETEWAKKGAIQRERVLSMEEFRQKGGNVAPLEGDNGQNVTKSVRRETNEGVDPESRKYIRGVLHTDPGKVRVGSYAILLVELLLILSFLPLPLIFVDKEVYLWAVFAPILVIPAGLIFLLVARGAACPVCRQKQYVPKACRKHVKSHHIPVVGKMASTAIHIILFKWFRCIFCGTSIRLKE